MNKQKKISGVERKKEIIKASIPLFAKKGFYGTTTKQIAQSAKVSEALLYKHFSGKDEIYKEIQTHCLGTSKVIEEQLKGIGLGSEYIILGVRLLAYSIIIGLPNSDNIDDIKRLLISSLLEDGAFIKEFLQNGLGSWFPKIEECFEIAKAKKEIEFIEIDNFNLNNNIWFVQHLTLTLSVFLLNDVIDYKYDNIKLFEQLVLFCLRGIGFKNSIIKKYNNSKKLKIFDIKG